MTRRATRIGRLARFGRLKEDKAAYAWREAIKLTMRARQAHEQAVSLVGEIAAWKSTELGSAALNIDHYQAALEMESHAVTMSDERLVRLLESEQQTQATIERLRAAKASLKSAERRQAREALHMLEAAEKKSFDELRDVWLAGQVKACD